MFALAIRTKSSLYRLFPLIRGILITTLILAEYVAANALRLICASVAPARTVTTTRCLSICAKADQYVMCVSCSLTCDSLFSHNPVRWAPLAAAGLARVVPLARVVRSADLSRTYSATS